MNSHDYIDLLEIKLLEHGKELMGENFTFQQDNDAIHNSKLTKAWFIEKSSHVMEWLASSPDLDSIENLWEYFLERFMKMHLSTLHTASCEEYRVVSSLFGIGKSTANLIVHEFVNAVNDVLLPKYVKFPLSQENLNKCSRDFETILGFPECVGTVDGCHIPISAPKNQAISDYNYKEWYFIILFAVVDCRYRIIYTSVGSPGRNIDRYILQNSSLKRILESNFFDKCYKELSGFPVLLCLTGDSAFPLTRHFLKLYPKNLELSEFQKNYNKIFCGARRVVENAFGPVKARFRVICKRMECNINFATRIVNACVTLHNICSYYDDIIIIEWLTHHNDDSVAQPNTVSTAGNNGPGKNVRDLISKYLYERAK
ncbi:uncharacterized protein LOC136091141 [Hydra vulgaris]|uniref:Uncharacterized protein LOC136091141 n=1 Tax=Hydra vulgaris TaxID=6087 RepID=A0ABM4DI90_HYDVU